MTNAPELFVRHDGRAGARNHVLVLPSVICAARVATAVADAIGAVGITHQHGCSQVGDDAIQTAGAFEEIACHPNVGGTLVVSLGCETVQGRELAARVEARGQTVRFVGIQEAGGSQEAVEEGRRAGLHLVDAVEGARRESVPIPRLVVGVERSRPSALAEAFVEHALAAGATIVRGHAGADGSPPARAVAAFSGPRAAELLGGVVVSNAGHGPQQHVALAAVGAQVIVSFPGDRSPPLGFSICPVVTVGGDSPLHRALAGDFDADESVGAKGLWELVLAVAGGEPCAAERRGSREFVLERLARAM